MTVKLIAFDMDGTLTTEPSSWEYVHRIFNLWEGRADAHMARFLAGEITYEEFSLLDAMEWRGTEVSQLETAMSSIGYSQCAREAVQAAREVGAKVAIVSSGLALLAQRVGRELGVDWVFANELVPSADGVLTGEVVINVSIDDPGLTKAAIVRRLRQIAGASKRDTWAVGDNWGDIPMFEEAGTAVMIRPSDQCYQRALLSAPHTVRLDSLCSLVGILKNA